MKISLDKLNKICEKVGLKAIKKSQKIPNGYHLIQVDRILKEVIDDLCISFDYVQNYDFDCVFDNYSLIANLVA